VAPGGGGGGAYPGGGLPAASGRGGAGGDAPGPAGGGDAAPDPCGDSRPCGGGGPPCEPGAGAAVAAAAANGLPHAGQTAPGTTATAAPQVGQLVVCGASCSGPAMGGSYLGRPADPAEPGHRLSATVRAPVETFTDEERAALVPHFTNLDRPVFALVDLPETVKGALFARYSRYRGTLRRLFLDEFAGDVEGGAARALEGPGGERAAALYERIFLGYGDDSVAQLGGAHLAFEWVSNVVTKVLQRGRLAAYLEQSTRYIPYDAPMPGGGYRYWRDDSLGPEYEAAMDSVFDAYAEALPRVERWAAERFPRRDGEPEAAHRRSVRAKALDLLRGLLPAASLSHVGMYASGQAYEGLVMRLLASPLPEARELGRMALAELEQVIPSFLARVGRVDRGGRWIEYLDERERAADRAAARLGLDRARASEAAAPAVRLLSVRGSEEDLLAALLFEAAAASEEDGRRVVRELPPDERARLLAELCGKRENRRHRPGRGFEAVSYRFEVVSDYGAFRDLQRHRMLTVQWQRLSPDLGAAVPEELEAAGVDELFARGLERSRREHDRLAAVGLLELAPYALCLAYRIRYVLDMNAREAMHLIELRAGREGHPSYRAVARELHAQIARAHPAIAAAMTHLDRETEPRLERILAEIRSDARRADTQAPAPSS
jgi:thymidylate synthase ThyX